MKKRFIFAMLLTALFFTACSSKGEVEPQKEEKTYFDFTHTEIVNKFEETIIDFTLGYFNQRNIFDGNEEGEKLASYVSTTDTMDITNKKNKPMIRYLLSYDETTEKVSSIILTMQKELTLFEDIFLYHIVSLIECIEPNAETSTLYTQIEDSLGKYAQTRYEGESFYLSIADYEDHFIVYFTPTKKGNKE